MATNVLIGSIIRSYSQIRNHSYIGISRRSGGQAAIIAVIFFLTIGLAVSMGVLNPVLRQVKQVDDFTRTRASLYVSQAVNEDALYRLKTGKQFVSPSTLSLNGYTATATSTVVADGIQINSSGNAQNLIRNIQTHLTAGTVISFGYGMQAGQGGFELRNNTTVVGNIYSNGSIITSNQVSITGTAIAANSAATVADQSNGTVFPPSQSIKFRDTDSTQDFAQSFTTSTTSAIVSVRVYIKKAGDPSDLDFKIYSNNAGIPGTKLAEEQINANLITTSYGWLEAVFESNPVLTAGTTYWLVIDNDGDNSTRYYTIAADSNGYANGQAKVGKLQNSTWNNTTPSGLDGYFTLYLGGGFSVIDGANGPAEFSVGGDAWAHTVSGTSVTGNLYCQSGMDNNKTCDSSRPDPSPQGYPVSDANIAEWKEDASAGGTITGNYTVDNTSVTLGPKKITGNLTVSGQSGVLTISGTIWVQGNILIENKGSVKLASSYGANSGLILSDGWIDMQDHADLTGSGQTGSYLMMLTTSSCTENTCSGHNAIELKNKANAVILNAQNGTVELQDHADLKEVTGKTIKAINQTTVTYETGLANVNFVGGATSGYSFDRWREVQ